MDENIFNKIPNWLRYIVSIPVGIIAVIVCYYIGYLGNLWVASPDSLMMHFYTFLYQNCINVFILIGTICYILPKYQIQFTITISILFCALGFVGLGMTILVNNITIMYIIGFILTFSSFVVSCIYVLKKYYKENTRIVKEDESSNENNLSNILSNQDKLSNIIAGREKINEKLLLNKQNPYTGKIIQNYDDIIEYLKMYQLDDNGINPFEALKKN